MKRGRHNTPVRRQQPIAPAISRKCVRALLSWFSTNARDLPWRRTRDPYAIWISEVMLQQTQVATVVPYWERWMARLPTLSDLASAPPDKVLKLWEGLGYYNRARNLQSAAAMIVNEHNGRFPQTLAALLDLPGIGRYTAGAICSIAYNQPTPILDGNVIRLLTRLFGIDGNPKAKATNDRLWIMAEELVQTAAQNQSNCSNLNQSLMEMGALICTPDNPSCESCPVRRWCVAHRDGRIGELPDLGPRTKTTARHFMAFIVEHEGRILVRQRPASGINAGLWEFPTAQTNGAPPTQPLLIRAFAKAQLSFSMTRAESWFRIRRSVTRYRDTIEVFRARIASGKMPSEKSRRWFALNKLDELAFTGAHRKILNRLQKDEAAGH